MSAPPTAAAAADDSDSDSSDVDEEARAGALVARARDAPRDYNAHLAACAALRAAGMLVELRKAREAFAREFPLTPALWTAWVQDEVAARGTSKRGARLAVADLYARATADYFDAALWTARLKHERGMLADGVVAVDRVRAVFKAALVVAGHAVATAADVWAAYMAFEAEQEEVPSSSSSSACSSSSSSDAGVRPLRVPEISRLQRQLAIPMDGSEAVMETVEARAEATDPRALEAAAAAARSDDVDGRWLSRLRRAHAQALSRRYARETLEKLTSTASAPSDAERRWLQYVDFERRSSSPPAALRAVYERAVAKCALSPALWMGYCNFLAGQAAAAAAAGADNSDAGGDSAGGHGGGDAVQIRANLADVRARAVRNITYSGRLWAEHLLSCEATGGVAGVERALARATAERMAGPHDYASVWLAYCRATRRLTAGGASSAAVPTVSAASASSSSAVATAPASSPALAAATRARAFLEQHFGAPCPAAAPLVAFAAAEHERRGDYTRAREAHEEVCETLTPTLWSCWSQFIAFSRRMLVLSEVAATAADNGGGGGAADSEAISPPKVGATVSRLYRRAAQRVTDHVDLLVSDWQAYEGSRGTHAGASACHAVAVSRAEEIAVADKKARDRWKLDATIAARKAATAGQGSKMRKKTKAAAPGAAAAAAAAGEAAAAKKRKRPGKGKKRTRGQRDGGGEGDDAGEEVVPPPRKQLRDAAGAAVDSEPRPAAVVAVDRTLVFLTNAPKEASTADVQEALRAHGTVTDVVFLLNKNAEPYGRAVVQFDTESGATAAIEAAGAAAGLQMGTRTLRLHTSKLGLAEAREKNAKHSKKVAAGRKMRLAFVPRGVARNRN